ncbi:hypothetical protein DUNSADRAFT_2292 [Dunaliella salina]|uniref:Encoded protein n=1 Tax=Dunaliella salina TaxID=3046 RepID=A0ABQ7GVV9_DUNSA|nr:hypothetical protein DUNSADRAFT_2292 [Dunaliella salina]|eukprot:KAF5838748.1 hypothetical protein DUNSADRAFT_2292 [Dunaliella salina]
MVIAGFTTVNQAVARLGAVIHLFLCWKRTPFFPQPAEHTQVWLPGLMQLSVKEEHTIPGSGTLLTTMFT